MQEVVSKDFFLHTDYTVSSNRADSAVHCRELELDNEVTDKQYWIKKYNKNQENSSKIRHLCRVIKINMKRGFKVKEVIDILMSQGWYLDRQNGTSHRQF